MVRSLLYSLAFAITLLFQACSGSKNELKIVSKNFDSEVEQQQNLVFSFNKDLVPDSLLQRWDSTEYLQIVPKIRGQFKWNSSSELLFSPSEKLLPGKEYEAKLTKKLLEKSKVKYPISDKPIQFRTAPLRVMGARASWTRGQSMANVVVQLDLTFNYEVKTQDAIQRLKLSSAGKEIMTTALGGGSGKTISVQFVPVSEKDEDVTLQVSLAKGIPIAGDSYTSPADTSFQTMIPSRYHLTVTNIMAQHSGLEGTVVVNTSQPLLDENLKSLIRIEPSVPFELITNEAGFVITSNELKADQTYELTISSHVEGIFGGRLKKDITEQIGFGKLSPSISFANEKGMYLSSKGFKNLVLNIVNVPKVEVTVMKVYENNLEHFIRREKRYGYYYDDEAGEGEENYGSYYYYETEEFGDTIWHKEYETSKLPKLNAARVLHLDFQDKIKSYDGVYVISVRSKEHKWVLDSKILALSDIGLIVKEEKDNMYVFANSIRNAKPLSDVKISFVSTNNQKIFASSTDGEGVAVFRNISKTAPGFRVGLVTAKMDGEFSFVWLGQSEVQTSRFDVGGRVPNSTSLNAMIYAERNLYRPGETAHVSTIVRDENWGNPGEMPVKLKLVMPNGKELSTMRKILNEEGSCETSFAIPTTATTGTYLLEAYTGNDVLLNTYNLSVEDFMPDRIKAEVKINKTEFGAGDTVIGYLKADNLFGTPAANRNYEIEMSLSKTAFSPKGFDDYDFSVTNNFPYSTQFASGQTNERGMAASKFELKPELRDMGVLKGNLTATVFDETGRPVHRYENFQVYTQSVLAGVKMADYYVGTGNPLRAGLVAVDKNGNPRNAQLQTTLIKKEWNTVIQRDGQRYKYVSQKDEKIVSRKLITVSGTSSYFMFTPEQSGEYELRVAVNGSNSYVSKTFYAWGGGRTAYSSFEVNNEGNVTIKTDKEKYRTGEDIDLLFTTPFDGRMLVTIERDKILQHLYLNTSNKSASYQLKASDLLVPNVYVTATLIRPMDGSDLPLTVAHGFKSVPVENPQNHLPVSVSLVAKSRSKTKQTISVKTEPNAYVTVAAVDEGILQVKNYKTPDPYQYFYQKVALSTRSYDIYPLLLPEVKLTRSSTGGDGADESAMRVTPLFVNRVKNVSFWSGILRADSRGMVRYDIDVPQFSGDIRVMAVAYKGRSFGGADQHMKVADPIIISTALPRFLSPEDEVILPVVLSNTTGGRASANVTISVQGPLQISGGGSQTIAIAPNSEGRAVFRLSALKSIGAGKVSVTVRALNETFLNETEISIRPPASLQKQFSSGQVAANATQSINTSHNFIPSTVGGKIIIGKSPLVQFTKNLSELLQYPYGCVEQTVSAAFPQLYYTDLAKLLQNGAASSASPAYHVQQAILKLQSMQLSNGSLAYWPSGGSESWWGSIYAAHFLYEAKKAGYEVNDRSFNRLMQYLKYRLTRRETEILYYNENLKKEIAAKEIAYSLYVLALTGQPQLSTMNYYKAHLEMLSIDSKYLLAGAYALSGQKTQAKQVQPSAFEGEKAKQSLDGNFYSYLRDQAIALNSLLETDPKNPQIGIMARQLSEQVKKARYLNTQENVWTILAFGKIARSANKTDATATILVDGKPVATSKETATLDLKKYAGKKIAIQVKGNGGFYYFTELSGISSDGSLTEEDSYIKVRRTFFDRNGKQIGNNFRQNDLIVVRISLQSQYAGTVENVAVTDMLPAGLEIENTRLNDLPEMKWIKENDEADYVDFRDDRINLFTTATQKTKEFYYMVRAVSPGVFKLGPVQADAMYDGSYHSYNGAGTVNISER